MRIGIDFGIRCFAVTSDGKYIRIEGKWNVAKMSVAVDELVTHVAENASAVVIEGIHGNSPIAFSVKWFRKSLRRRFPDMPIIVASSTFPSSKTCSSCGHYQAACGRSRFICESCHLEIDRDYNAALNLSKYRKV